ncbi:hypothetical protein ACFQ21_00315 [Ohtaekwangia kribbensis]|uniref:Peptidase M48 domain-containing protein n=1 Tax=Ohtaekwangia kribbensis TaxID=688913 RepID=A0ABW3JX20_9BACT
MRRITLTSFTLSLLLLAGCTGCGSFDFDQTLEYTIDARLQKHVDAFFLEAEQRGIYIPKENLTVCIVDDLGASGRGFKNGQQSIVKISRDAYEWYISQGEEEVIEFLMFHELGHAVLNREHCDPKYSIMAQGLSMHTYEGDSVKRAALVDELFFNY